MKTDLRRFAPLGLVLSLLALISLVALLIIKGLNDAGFFTLGNNVKTLEQAEWVSLAIIVLGLAATAFLDPDGTRKFFIGRQVQYGSNSIIMLVAFVGILFFINMLAYQNPVTKDMTEDQQNSLAPESVKLLSSLPQSISIRAYYSARVSRDSIQKLLDNFKQNSNGKLTYVFNDLYQDPVTAQQDGVGHDSTLVLQMGSHKEISSLGTEQDLDSAIVRLINPQSRTVYFVTGHGEPDTQSEQDTSLTQVRNTLQNKNYTVKVLNLGSVAKIPADAKVVIEAGPQEALTSDQAKMLQDYVNGGGGLIVMEDPPALTKIGTADDPLADMLAKSFNITLENDVVIDAAVQNPLFVYADVKNYAQHPITESLAGLDTVFHTARSLKLDTAAEGITLTPLVQTETSTNVWGETDFKSFANHTVGFEPSTDIASPLVLAAAWENQAAKGRLVVFGDSEFAADALYKQGYGDILINSIDWASSQEDLISLTPKNNITRTYKSPSTASMIGIFLLSLCVIPLMVVVGGVVAWYTRRRRG